jgi:hypothetical protein
MTTSARLGLFAIALASACDYSQYPYCEGETVAYPEDEPTMSRERVVAQVLPTESKAVDILFVIDNSSSMTDEQNQLGIWSSEMFDVLSESGELPDLHVAVTSSSVAIAGVKGCELGGKLHPGNAVLDEVQYLRDAPGVDGSRVRNYSGTLTDTFAKMALVGDGGCGLEQPFKAARLALSGTEPGSAGFLREDALLLIVFVTDEDDCSSTDGMLFVDGYGDACSEFGRLTSYRCFEQGVVCYDGKGDRELGERSHCRPDESSPYVESVERFAAYLKGLKKDPAQVVVAGIYGKPNHIEAIADNRVAYIPRLANVCGSSFAEGDGATPAIRMNALLAQFGGRASQSSICDSELSWAMRDVGLIARGAATRSHCLRGSMRDSDARTLGIQPACYVEAQGDVPRRLPRCRDADDTGCFTVDVDPACSETETQLAFHVRDREDRTLTVACDVDL